MLLLFWWMLSKVLSWFTTKKVKRALPVKPATAAPTAVPNMPPCAAEAQTPPNVEAAAARSCIQDEVDEEAWNNLLILMHCTDVSQLQGPEGRAAAAAALRAAGMDPHTSDACGTTSMHNAAFVGNEAAVVMLLAAGADPRARDSFGRTPYDVANSDVIRRLLASPSQSQSPPSSQSPSQSPTSSQSPVRSPTSSQSPVRSPTPSETPASSQPSSPSAARIPSPSETPATSQSSQSPTRSPSSARSQSPVRSQSPF